MIFLGAVRHYYSVRYLLPVYAFAVLLTPLLGAEMLISIVRGNHAIYDIQSSTPLPVIAQVTTPKGLPVTGAMVIFRTPASGPSGAFGRSRSLTVVTDSGGFAFAHGLRPNSTPGGWTMEIEAHGRGRRAMDRVAQTNRLAPAMPAAAPSPMNRLDTFVGGVGLLGLLGLTFVWRSLRRHPIELRPAQHAGRRPKAQPMLAPV